MRILLSGLVTSLVLLTGCAGASSGAAPAADSARAATSASASTASTTTGAPTVLAYSFRPGTVKVDRADLVSRMDGVVALPADLTSGPKPVVFLVHGSYPGCAWPKKEKLINTKNASKLRWPDYCGTKKAVNDHGMTSGPVYLRHTAAFAVYADRLARAGIIAVALDVQAKESNMGMGGNASLIQRRLLEKHAQLMRDINDGNFHGLPVPAAAKGAFDFAKVGVVGHSSGAGFVTDWMTKPIPGLDLKAAVGFQPALNSGAPQKIANPIPTLWFAGGCDEQAGPAGVRRDARDMAKANAGGTTIWAEQGGSTHLAMIGGGDSTVGPVAPVKTAACSKKRQAKPGQARVAAAAVMTNFFTTAFAGGTAYDLPSAAPTTIKARVLGGSGASVKVTPVSRASLGRDIRAKTIRYTSIDEQLLTEPKKPITPQMGGGNDDKSPYAGHV